MANKENQMLYAVMPFIPAISPTAVRKKPRNTTIDMLRPMAKLILSITPNLLNNKNVNKYPGIKITKSIPKIILKISNIILNQPKNVFPGLYLGVELKSS